MIDEALDTVQASVAATFWAVAKAAPECHEEAPFAVLENKGGLPAVLTGVIDLVQRTGDGWKIVDYKTDRKCRGIAGEVRGADCGVRARLAAIRSRGCHLRAGVQQRRMICDKCAVRE